MIGGSLGGLFAGCLLRTVGWDATVFERTAGDLAGRGAGLGTRAELFAVMRRLGLALDPSIGTQVRSRIGLDARGARLCEVPLASVTTAWDRLHRALKAALPAESYRAAMPLVRFADDGRKVVAQFANGQCEEGDLLVGADGLQSTVRAQLLPDLAPRYAGYVGCRGVAADDGALDPLAFDHMLFGFPPGEVALAIPAPPVAAQGAPRRCHFTWFRPADAAGVLPRLMTDARGREHAISIPPPLIRPDLIDDMKADAARRLAPQIAGVVTRTAQPLLQPIVDLESPRLAFGRAVLLGDAAFVARPHVGTGVTKAALDAQGLADALQAHGDDIDAALARYDAERRAFGAALVARGRYLGGWLAAQSAAASESAAAWRDRGVEDFIRAFGSAGVS